MTTFTVEFTSATAKLSGERRSKLLSPSSALFAKVRQMQDRLRAAGLEFDERMAPHIELLNRNEDSAALLVARAGALEGRAVSIADELCWVGRALALAVGPVDGYKGTAHVTIAFLKSGVKHDAAGLAKLRALLLD